MEEYKFDIKEVFSRRFDLINLPSEGVFYENKKSNLRIRFLSGLEESLLCSYFMNESGESLYLVLENLILDKFDLKDLVISDLQGIITYIYSSTYGDRIKLETKCPHCSYKDDETMVALSSLNFKKTNSKIINGKFYLYIPFNKHYEKIVKETKKLDEDEFVEIIIKPITFGDILKSKKDNVDLKNSITKMIYSIESIGFNDNKSDINQFINSLNLGEFKKLQKIISGTEVGLEEFFTHSCISCGAENKYNLNLGHDFLKLPETHVKNILEECFLLSHYNDGGMSFDAAMKIPVNERRYLINRLQEELAKKQEAEKKAYEAAKSKSRK